MKTMLFFAALAAATGTQIAHAQSNSCPAARQVVDIRGTTDPVKMTEDRDLLKESLAKDNTIVRLGPDVDLDFKFNSGTFFPLFFGRCVTLTSVVSFEDAMPTSTDATGRAASPVTVPPTPEARTPHSRGPVLRFGQHRDGAVDFFNIDCPPNTPASDNVRISGFSALRP